MNKYFLSVFLLMAPSAYGQVSGGYARGYVDSLTPDGILILETRIVNRPYIALTNYHDLSATLGHHITVPAVLIGVYSYGDSPPLQLWRYDPPNTNFGVFAYEAAKTNAEHGAQYIQNAKTVLAGLEAHHSLLEREISTNPANTNALSTLQLQLQNTDEQIEKQKQNVDRLEHFYHLNAE